MSTTHLPPWHLERERKLQYIFAGIAASTPAGKFSRALRRAARRLKGQRFKCDPERRWRMSAKSLRRLYYQWRANGKSVAAIRLRYGKSTRPRVTRPVLRAFVRICGEPGTRSCLEAFRKLQREWPSPLPISYSSFVRYLGRKTLNQLQNYHRAVAIAEAALDMAKAQVEADVLRPFPLPVRSAA